MSDKHKRGLRKNQFCWVAADKPCSDCPTPGTNYRKACEDETSDWSSHDGGAYQYLEKVSGGGTAPKSFEAHHLICVDSMSSAIAATKASRFVAPTKWCINQKVNMLAMPLWGHTVKYYCDLAKSKPKKGFKGIVMNVVSGPPGWANLPQHDHDHNCGGGYRDEATAAVKAKLKDLKDQGHKTADPTELKGDLDTISKDFRALLKRRGKRPIGGPGAGIKGTHAVWGPPPASSAGSWPPKDWYLPYSMADDGVASGRPLPRLKWDAKAASAVARLAARLMGK